MYHSITFPYLLRSCVPEGGHPRGSRITKPLLEPNTWREGSAAFTAKADISQHVSAALIGH